jgi:hypothetical protein
MTFETVIFEPKKFLPVGISQEALTTLEDALSDDSPNTEIFVAVGETIEDTPDHVQSALKHFGRILEVAIDEGCEFIHFYLDF